MWFRNPIKYKKRDKVFVIGANKTGTTSLGDFLTRAGYRLGDQYRAECLFEDWSRRNWKPIIQYCSTADAFQDIPFSLPYTYIPLDHAFPSAKFIMTVRESDERWYQSFYRHLQRITGKKVVDREALFNYSNNHPKGYLIRTVKAIYNQPEDDLLNPEGLKAWYRNRNQEAREYFRFRQEDFIEINIDQDDAGAILREFLCLDSELKLRKLNAAPE